MAHTSRRRSVTARPIHNGWVCILLSTFTLAGHAQSDADGLMRSGNEQFRSGNYAAAIRSYESAAESGQHSALLYYNLGVAYYRNGNFAAARGAFRRASADADLASLSYYNLGLTSRAYGDYEDARQWFERVLSSSSDARLVSLAQQAIAASSVSAQPPAQAAAPSEAFRPYRPNDEPAGEFRLVLGARAGQNDNVYRSPAQPYTDLGQPGQPVITPVVQSASFVPVDLLALYVLDSDDSDTQFRFSYRLDGDFYSSEFSNADEISQRFEIGANVELEGRARRELRSAIYFSHHDETSFDPDDGIDREVEGEDISDRLAYGSAAMRSSYEHELENWAFGFDALVERRRYQDVQVVASYDHERYSVRMWTQYRILRNTSVELGVRSLGRRYDSRRARDLNGDMLSANDTLRYLYSGADLRIEHRLGRSFSVEGAFSQIDREDRFLGYADYTQNIARMTMDYRFNGRARASVSAVARRYDYPNAFAFNDPLGGALELESTDIEFELDYRFRPNLSLWAEFDFRDVTSTDPRIAYERTRSMLGIRWRN